MTATLGNVFTLTVHCCVPDTGLSIRYLYHDVLRNLRLRKLKRKRSPILSQQDLSSCSCSGCADSWTPIPIGLSPTSSPPPTSTLVSALCSLPGLQNFQSQHREDTSDYSSKQCTKEINFCENHLCINFLCSRSRRLHKADLLGYLYRNLFRINNLYSTE